VEQPESRTKPKGIDEAECLRLLEAALYVSGRPLDLKRLSSVTKVRSKKLLKKLLDKLIESYSKRDAAIEILRLENERYVMQLKPKYTMKVRRLSMKPLLSLGPLRTLAYIAYRQPISQSRVIAVRGKHAYRHLNELERMDLIKREKKREDIILTTTAFFADYFGLSHNLSVLKRQLKRTLLKSANEES